MSNQPCSVTTMLYGFIDYLGNRWCDAWVDSYNNHTEIIDRLERKEQLSPMSKQSLEIQRNLRHQHFMQCVDLANITKSSG